ncbi:MULTISPECIES: carbohydrate ABC transporter permease [Halorussus]|uniref:carbohydrate ABC transporter permease n=1 Tax=Halorussus TaxID=1070314 RepID=UPI00209C96E1|nr:carbohydrate ABC transporter permease [Halorussus vallis]USZ77372.1 carbohydrate ABC transporter permease [Halorussus vallis]
MTEQPTHRTEASNEDLESRLRTAGLYVALYGAAFLFLLPYLWMISTSLKPKGQLFSQVPHWIPSEITFAWYRQVLTQSLIVEWTINTFIIAVSTTVLVLVVDSLIAFSLTRLDWPGKNVVLAVIVASFMVPTYVNIVPLYTLVSELGLLNNYLAVILPLTAGPLGVFLLVQFFRDFPDEVEEAARLDGFSSFQIYTRLVLPLMKSPLTALALFTFVTSWNNFLWPLLVLQSNKLYTLPIGLVTLSNSQVFQPGLAMAATLIASLPLFIVFLMLQDYLINAIQIQGTTG